MISLILLVKIEFLDSISIAYQYFRILHRIKHGRRKKEKQLCLIVSTHAHIIMDDTEGGKNTLSPWRCLPGLHVRGTSKAVVLLSPEIHGISPHHKTRQPRYTVINTACIDCLELWAINKWSRVSECRLPFKLQY